MEANNNARIWFNVSQFDDFCVGLCNSDFQIASYMCVTVRWVEGYELLSKHLHEETETV